MINEQDAKPNILPEIKFNATSEQLLQWHNEFNRIGLQESIESKTLAATKQVIYKGIRMNKQYFMDYRLRETSILSDTDK